MIPVSANAVIKIMSGVHDGYVDDVGLSLPTLELRLFSRLVAAKGKICSFRELAYFGWGSDSETVHMALKTAICRLREMLSGTRVTVRCHRDVGYRLVTNREPIGEPSSRQYRADGIHEAGRLRAACDRAQAAQRERSVRCTTMTYCAPP